MAKKNDCWGIEVGSHAIKAMRLVRTGNEVSVEGYDMLRFNKVLTAPDVDADEQIQVNLEKLLNRHKKALKGRTIMVSVPGHMAFARFAKLPPVEPKNLLKMVNFEAVQQIPFPINQVEWDYQIFSEPDSPDVEVGIFAITKDRIGKFLENFENVGLDVDGVSLSPLALYNSMAYDMEITPESPGHIFMDIGTTSTDLIIVEGGSIWLRTLPIGGNNFTEALVRSFKLSFEKAEKLKREAGTSKYARQIFQAMRPVFADLVQEMQRSLGYYQSINREANLTRLIGFGSTFRLPGLQKFLKQQLQMDVSRLDAFDRAVVEGKKAADFAERTINMGTAYGLALQGVGLGHVDANLLPKEVVKNKVWKAKQPWAAGAAASLVVATALAGMALARAQSSYGDIKEATDRDIQPVLNDANQYVREWKDIEGGNDPRGRIENLRRVLDYRDAWPKLMADLSAAIDTLSPQPALTGSNYAEIAKIPRAQRNRIYIEEFTAEYQFQWDKDAPTQEQNTEQSFNIEDIWGAMAEEPADDPEAEGGGEMSWIDQQREREQRAAEAGAGASTPPSFKITIKGYSPTPDTPEKLANTIIRWLKDNDLREDRPYKIVVPENPLLNIAPVRETVESSPRVDRNRPAARGMMGPGAAQPRFGRPAANQNQNQQAVGLTVSDLLPKRPLAEEVREKDWSFTITWDVHMLPPDAIRETEQAARDESPAPTSSSPYGPISR